MITKSQKEKIFFTNKTMIIYLRRVRQDRSGLEGAPAISVAK